MKGFTLIELLIVIAIIGVLSAVVIVSLGSQTENAEDAAVQSGVSSLRASAITAVNMDEKTGIAICNTLYDKISAEKSGWFWNASTMCARNTLVDANGLVSGVEGDLCCYADGSDWAIWGGLSGADGFGTNTIGAGPDTTKPKSDVYCADSSGYLGEVDLAESDASNPKLATAALTVCNWRP